MADFLRNWIVNITVIIVFIMFLDTIMPNDLLKRYVKVIIGLFVIISLIKPFILVKDYAKGFNTEFMETASYIEKGGSYADNDKISKFQMQKAVEIFEDNIKNQIIKLVKRNAGSRYRKVAVELELESNIDKEDFGGLKSIIINLTEGENNVIEVDKIRIEVNEEPGENKNVINRDKAEYNLNDSRIKNNIKDEISKAFGISESIISVNILK